MQAGEWAAGGKARAERRSKGKRRGEGGEEGRGEARRERGSVQGSRREAERNEGREVELRASGGVEIAGYRGVRTGVGAKDRTGNRRGV